MNVGSQIYDEFVTPTTRNRRRKAQRESIARGETIFDNKVFIISKVAGLNDIKGSLNGEPGTCSTCHSNKNVLNDTAGDPKRLGIMDNSNGVETMPWTPDFPRLRFIARLPVSRFSPIRLPRPAAREALPATRRPVTSSSPPIRGRA